jgi:hypothetical protein
MVLILSEIVDALAFCFKYTEISSTFPNSLANEDKDSVNLNKTPKIVKIATIVVMIIMFVIHPVLKISLTASINIR